MKYEQEYESLIDSKLPQENKNKKFEDEYTIIEELLISKKVKIFKVQSKKDRLTCRTMHRIQKSSFCNLNDDRIMFKEFELLSNLEHPNIIKLITFFTNDMNFNIISEYFKEGTLETKIQKHKIFSENQAKYVCKQLLNAIKYLNEHNLVHTDINPDIIYIKDIIKRDNEELYNIKILQFGSSSINIHKSNNSLNYMAPEIINNKYHQTSDIWSIGIILYQMIFDDLPFKGYKEDEIINNIMRLKPDIINKDASPYVKNLLKKMLNKNPLKRITVTECLKHDWFSVTVDKYKKNNNNTGSNEILKNFFLSHISGHSGEIFKNNKVEEDTHTYLKKQYNKKVSKKEEKVKEEEKEKEKKINEKHFLENSKNSDDSIEEESSSDLSDESEESEESKESKESKSKSNSDSNSSQSYTAFSPSRCRSNSICIRRKNIFSEFGKRYNHKKPQKDDKKNDKKVKSKVKNEFSPKKKVKKLDTKNDEKKGENKINQVNNKENDESHKIIKLISLNNSDKNNNLKVEIKKVETLMKLNKKEIIKHISLNNRRLFINSTNCSHLKRSFSLSILDDSSDKSNGQKLSPLLIDTMKYMKYNIQYNYYKYKEIEKIEKIFDKIIDNKNKIKININKLTITYDDLFTGYLNYIGQKIFLLDSYSENKKIFKDLSKYINEDKKNGNIINTSYDKEDFIRILMIFKEKYLEFRLKKSYQKLKKSNVHEIFNLLNEIEQKVEFNYYKKYFNEIKNLLMKNKLKEIYLFYEYKNLLVNSIKSVFNKENIEKKEKEKQKKEKERQKKKSYSPENSKNNGIKGIIRVVTKRDNSKNKIIQINNNDDNVNNIYSSIKNDSA